MYRSAIVLSTLSCLAISPLAAQTLINPGFEQGWSGWTDVDPNKDATSISGHFNTGVKSAKITKDTGRFEQSVRLLEGSEYELTAVIKGPGVIGLDLGGETITANSPGEGETWASVTLTFTTTDAAEAVIFGQHNGEEGRFDDFQLIAKSGPALAAAEAAAAGPPVYATLDTCDRLSQLRVKSAEDDGTSEETHPPTMAVDHDFQEDSRWSSKGAGKDLILDLGLPQTLKEVGIAWLKGDARKSYFDISASVDGKAYALLRDRSESGGETTLIERYDIDDTIARYVKITGYGNTDNEWSSIVEVQPYGCGLGEIASTGDGSEQRLKEQISSFGLNTALPPAQNFDLTDWKITIPVDGDGDSRADEIGETDLAAGWENRDVFYTDPVTGGMVFRSLPGKGATTPNSSYLRSELREMLRAGDTSIKTRINDGTPNKNNWVFSSAPIEAQRLAGGVDGVLRAKLSVDKVSRIGEAAKVGRVVIGQIHAKDDEPIRLYYRKLPQNTHGSIYYAHEIAGGDDMWIDVIGGRESDLANPGDGILLGEVFEYEIAVTGEEKDGKVHPILNLKIIRADGSEIIAPPLDMVDSGYSNANDFMYFKAGLYSQNNTSTWPERDVDQATFYALENSHTAPPQ